jgi:hypothetical protein
LSLDLLPGQARACDVLAGRVADHGREVTDQEDDLVSHLLERPQLPDGDRVTEVDVRGGRVEPLLDPQGDTLPAGTLQLPLEVLLGDALLDALQYGVHLFLDGGKLQSIDLLAMGSRVSPTDTSAVPHHRPGGNLTPHFVQSNEQSPARILDDSGNSR